MVCGRNFESAQRFASRVTAASAVDRIILSPQSPQSQCGERTISLIVNHVWQTCHAKIQFANREVRDLCIQYGAKYPNHPEYRRYHVVAV